MRLRLRFVGAGLRRLAGGLTGEIDMGLGMGLRSASSPASGRRRRRSGLGRAGRMAGIADGVAMFGMAGRAGLRRRRIAFAIPRAAAKGD